MTLYIVEGFLLRDLEDDLDVGRLPSGPQVLQKFEIDIDEHPIQPMGFGRLDLLLESDLLEFEEFADRVILQKELLDAQLLFGRLAQCFMSDCFP